MELASEAGQAVNSECVQVVNVREAANYGFTFIEVVTGDEVFGSRFDYDAPSSIGENCGKTYEFTHGYSSLMKPSIGTGQPHSSSPGSFQVTQLKKWPSPFETHLPP